MKSSMRLLISVVRRGRAERVVELVRQAGATGSTTILAKGTSRNRLLRFLCLADVEKEVVLTVAALPIMEKVKHFLRTAPDLCVKVPGIGIVLDVTDFFQFGASGKNTQKFQANDEAEADMEQKIERSLLFVIINAGLADELMYAARQAGATGGTILKARGTGREEDIRFFGINIVPEKEILLVMIEKEKEEKVLSAMKSSKELDKPGVGIIFSMPVVDFFQLGLKSNPQLANLDK